MSISIDNVTRVWSIKCVPDHDPNYEGEWIKTRLAQHALPDHTKFDEVCKLLKAWCPPGYHIVAYALDVKDEDNAE